MIAGPRPFDHAQPGTPEQAWSAAGVADLPELGQRLRLGPDTFLLVVAAHPDDESLAAAGLIAAALTAGGDVHVLLCTDGESSHPNSPSTTPQQLGLRRRLEFAEALEVLRGEAATLTASAGDIGFTTLGLPDGALRSHRGAVERAAAALLDARPSSRLIVVTPYRRDGHADHEAAGTALAGVARRSGALLLEAPIWFWHWADPVEDQEWRHWARFSLGVSETRAKDRSLAANISQVQPLSPQAGDEALLQPAFLSHFSRAFEVFRVTGPGHRDAHAAPAEFDDVHIRSTDPWQLEDSWYERRKRAILTAILPEEDIGAALELGCSVGISTLGLAERSARVVAVDASPVALREARLRVSAAPHVRLVQATLPDDWAAIGATDGEFSLVVVSETGYYLAEDELCELIAACRRALRPDGALVLCHWRGPIDGWPLDGDGVHARVGRLGLERIAHYEQPELLIDVYRGGGEAVGARCFAMPAATS